MKDATWTKNLFLLPMLITGFGVILAGGMTAQTFTTLYRLTEGSFTNGDGANPAGRLILSGNTLYGTTYGGGSSGNGTVFAVNIDGTGFTTLHTFTFGSDGGQPIAGLILSGNTLYGTASEYHGGSGKVFKLATDGTSFTSLHSFTGTSSPFYTNSDGTHPYGGLILAGDALYGTAYDGASGGNGTVFAVSATVFMLQSSTNLTSPTVWAAASPAPVVVNGQNAVTNPVSGTGKFYPLSQ